MQGTPQGSRDIRGETAEELVILPICCRIHASCSLTSSTKETTMANHGNSPNAIGMLNGKWSLLLRIALASYPLILAWCVWVTKNEFEDIAFRTQGDRFSYSDSLKLRADIEDKINKLPSQDWRDRIIAMEVNQQVMIKQLTRLETMTLKQNGSN